MKLVENQDIESFQALADPLELAFSQFWSKCHHVERVDKRMNEANTILRSRFEQSMGKFWNLTPVNLETLALQASILASLEKGRGYVQGGRQMLS